MVKQYLFRRRVIGKLICGLMVSIAGLYLVPSIAEIAPNPLTSYSPSGRDILVIMGNTTSMNTENLDSNIKRSVRVKRAIKDLVTDSSTAMAKAVSSGHIIGLGLMTYGGTRSDSVYITTSPYDAHHNLEFDRIIPFTELRLDENDMPYIFIGDSFRQACYDDEGLFNNLFYRDANPQSHPYCLPRYHTSPYTGTEVGYVRPVSIGACDGSGGNLLCYPSSITSRPTLGYLRIPIQVVPKYDTPAATTLDNTISQAIDEAFSHTIEGSPFEGALLTACDYFNTKLPSFGGGLSHCYRGYGPSAYITPITNVFSNNYPGGGQGITEQTPAMPNACSASIIYIADSIQNLTADGIPYEPDWWAVERNSGTPAYYDAADNFNYLFELGTNTNLSTDPASIAASNLSSMNQGRRIPTYFLGVGDNDYITYLDALAPSGANGVIGATAFYATTQSTLKNALNNIFSTILYWPYTATRNSSFASPASNSSDPLANTIYQPEFQSQLGWIGNIHAYTVRSDNKTIDQDYWNATEHLPNFAVRSIFSYQPGLGGIDFKYNQLSDPQKLALNTALNLLAAQYLYLSGTSANLVDWIRGNINLNLETGYLFRTRYDGVLGDILNSDPIFVGAEDYGYDVLPEGRAILADGNQNATSYQSFLNTKATRQRIVYVGANDGMLHGFNAGIYNANLTTYDHFDHGDGSEKIAYLPNALIGQRLVDMAAAPLGNIYYQHVFGIDGSPSVGDAYLNNVWKTALVGTMGAGGKAVFALDVTNPSTFSQSNATSNKVLWEISDTDSQAYTPIAGDATSIHRDLGYTFAQAAIVRLNGLDAQGKYRWGAVVANGYYSNRGHAVLFIFNLADGRLIKKIDVTQGENISHNGLSTPVTVDIDNNRTADYVYAGDLYGNLWKFDISSTNSSNWRSAYVNEDIPTPLFVACATTSDSCSNDNRQPITAKPNIGSAAATGQSNRGLMVYFGTGQFYELGDNIVTDNPQTQTFYGVWDNGSIISSKRSLQQQTIISQPVKTQTTTNAADVSTTQDLGTFRVTSTNSVNYAGTPATPDIPAVAAQLGWYMDLLTPSNGNSPHGSLGERVIAFPLLRSGRVIFETLIPNPSDSCVAGASSWIMEVDALGGNRLASGTPPWDLDADNQFTNNDLVSYGQGLVSPSGMLSPIGAVKTPAIFQPEKKCFVGTGPAFQYDTLRCIPESVGGGSTSRISWSQLK